MIAGPDDVAAAVFLAAAFLLGPPAAAGLSLLFRDRAVALVLAGVAGSLASVPALAFTTPAVVSGDLWAAIDRSSPTAPDDLGWQRPGRWLAAFNAAGLIGSAFAGRRAWRLPHP